MARKQDSASRVKAIYIVGVVRFTAGRAGHERKQHGAALRPPGGE